MRWIVGTLVLANIIALIWFLLSPDDQSATQAPVINRADAGESIKLLSELEQETLQTMLANKSRVTLGGDQESPGETLLCTLVGPFPRLLRAEYFVERLAALEINSSIQEVEIPGDIGYWVYLPPLESRKAAYNKLRELQAKGVDSYVIPRGELENGISFGMFSQTNLAQQRLADMQSAGYDAQLEEITRSYKEVWVNLPPGQASQLGQETWLEILGEEEGIERRQNYCPPVASD